MRSSAKPSDNLRIYGAVKTPRPQIDIEGRSSEQINKRLMFQRGKVSTTAASQAARLSAANVFPSAAGAASAASTTANQRSSASIRNTTILAPFDTSASATADPTRNRVPVERKVVDAPQRHRNVRHHPHTVGAVRASTVFSGATVPPAQPEERRTLLSTKLHSNAFEGSSNKLCAARRLKKVATPRRLKDGVPEEVNYRKTRLAEGKHHSTALPTRASLEHSNLLLRSAHQPQSGGDLSTTALQPKRLHNATYSQQNRGLSASEFGLTGGDTAHVGAESCDNQVRRNVNLQLNKSYSHYPRKKTHFAHGPLGALNGLSDTSDRQRFAKRVGGFLNQEHAYNGNPKVRSTSAGATRMMFPSGTPVATRARRSVTPALDGAGGRPRRGSIKGRAHSLTPSLRPFPLIS